VRGTRCRITARSIICLKCGGSCLHLLHTVSLYSKKFRAMNSRFMSTRELTAVMEAHRICTVQNLALSLRTEHLSVEEKRKGGGGSQAVCARSKGSHPGLMQFSRHFIEAGILAPCRSHCIQFCCAMHLSTPNRKLHLKPLRPISPIFSSAQHNKHLFLEVRNVLFY
jgi:hypothetical protein